MASKSSSFSPFVIAFGSEDFYLDRDIEKARQGRRSVFRIDGADITGTALVDLFESYSETPRTIIIDNAQSIKGNKKELRNFIESRDLSNPSLIIVAIVRDKKLPEVWELAASKGKKVERVKFKPWETDRYIKFVMSEAVKLRAVINKDTAQALYNYVGPDLYRLENELRKLAIYVGQAGTIKKEHITLITSPTPKAEPFQVAEQVISKNLRGAFNLFSILYRNSGDEALIPLVRSLMRQVEKMMVIRSLQERGVDESEIATSVGLREWHYKNIASPNARKHELKSLVDYMKRLCRLDVDVKGPSRSKRTLVELTMLTIAR